MQALGTFLITLLLIALFSLIIGSIYMGITAMIDFEPVSLWWNKRKSRTLNTHVIVNSKKLLDNQENMEYISSFSIWGREFQVSHAGLNDIVRESVISKKRVAEFNLELGKPYLVLSDGEDYLVRFKEYDSDLHYKVEKVRMITHSPFTEIVRAMIIREKKRESEKKDIISKKQEWF